MGSAHASCSRAVERLGYRRQQLVARERLRQDVAHAKLPRHGTGRARTAQKSGREKQYRAYMQTPDALDGLFGAERFRDVDDDQVRLYTLADGLRLRQRGIRDDCIARFAQPPFEQAENLVVGFDNQDALLLLHANISDPESVTNV